MKVEDTLLTILEAKAEILKKHCSTETTFGDIQITDVEQTLMEAQAKKTAEMYEAEHRKQIERLFTEIRHTNIIGDSMYAQQRFNEIKKKWLNPKGLWTVKE